MSKKPQIGPGQGQLQTIQQSVTFAGPLPPPSALEKYNEICPGAADRIIAMAERQSKHRQEIEKKVVEAHCRSQQFGPIYGFIVAMTAIIGGIYLIVQGRETTGLVAIITTVASLAAVFFYGRREEKKELQQKAEAFVQRRP